MRQSFILLRNLSSLFIVASVALVGCSSDDSEVNQSTAGSAGTAGTSGTAGSAGSSGAGGTAGTGGTGGTGGSAGSSGTGGTAGSAGTAGGSSGTSGTAGTGGTSACPDPVLGTELNPDDACSTLVADTAHPARINWKENYNNEINITSEMEFLWAPQFAVKVPAEGTYTIEYERCSTPPGGEANCSLGDLPIPDGVPSTMSCGTAFGPKFGVDPSQYQPGLNIYTFTIRLKDSTCVVSEDSYSINLTYTPAP
ncbi:MAG: hypothetical protein U0165_00870 [Polyangiaceae bacterium]